MRKRQNTGASSSVPRCGPKEEGGEARRERESADDATIREDERNFVPEKHTCGGEFLVDACRRRVTFANSKEPSESMECSHQSSRRGSATEGATAKTTALTMATAIENNSNNARLRVPHRPKAHQIASVRMSSCSREQDVYSRNPSSGRIAVMRWRSTRRVSVVSWWSSPSKNVIGFPSRVGAPSAVNVQPWRIITGVDRWRRSTALSRMKTTPRHLKKDDERSVRLLQEHPKPSDGRLRSHKGSGLR